jgi:hypothetical protein
MDIFSPVVRTDVAMWKCKLALRDKNKNANERRTLTKEESNNLRMICLGCGIHSSAAVALLKSVSASSTS